ncbi:MAG: hypothetical protein U0793_17275 [Gemmataceae bacterium]
MARSRWLRLAFFGLLLFWAFSHLQVGSAQDEGPVKERKETPAEKIRKALDQSMTLDFAGNSLEDVLNHLKAKTGVNFVLDRVVVGSLFPIDDVGGGMAPGAAQVHIKCDKGGKVRTALQRTLNAYNLTYVIVDDSVLVTTEEIGIYRQMRQRISVNVDNESLKIALKDLSRTTGLNLVLDPRQAKTADTKVTLTLEDATLETAVKLLAEMGNLKAVQMGNVLFVTDEDRARKIRKDEGPIHRSPNPLDGMLPPGVAVPGVGGIGGMGMGLGGVIGGPAGVPARPAVEAVPAPPPMVVPDMPPEKRP